MLLPQFEWHLFTSREIITSAFAMAIDPFFERMYQVASTASYFFSQHLRPIERAFRAVKCPGLFKESHCNFMLPITVGPNEIFGMPKEELDFRCLLVFAFVLLCTRNPEKRRYLSFLSSPTRRIEPFGSYARLRFCISASRMLC